MLRDALVEIGYGCAVPSTGRGIFVKIDRSTEWPEKHVFDWVLGFCLSQFVRHYCTGSRLRDDVPMPLAYRDSPRVSTKLFLDFNLAVLVTGAANAARVIRIVEREGA